MKIFPTSQKLFISFLLVLFVFISGCQKPFLEKVNVKQAKSIIAENKTNQKFAIIDVRTPQEFESFHLKDAKNIDFLAEDFEREISLLDKSFTYLIYCRSGGRSGAATKKMRELGFTRIYDVDGGVIEWQKDK